MTHALKLWLWLCRCKILRLRQFVVVVNFLCDHKTVTTSRYICLPTNSGDIAEFETVVCVCLSTT